VVASGFLEQNYLDLLVEGTVESAPPGGTPIQLCLFLFLPNANATGGGNETDRSNRNIMSTATTETVPGTDRKLTGKYLTFVLGQESYGIAVVTIREIIRMVDITSVPQMPEYVMGVINLRGKVIPIIDLRIKFQLAHRHMTERTCIVVVQVRTPAGNRSPMGLIVDAVEEVANINAEDIEVAPDFGRKLETDYILGMAKIKGKVKTLLEIDRVVAAESITLSDH